jgi:hypothetical protein
LFAVNAFAMNAKYRIVPTGAGSGASALALQNFAKHLALCSHCSDGCALARS